MEENPETKTKLMNKGHTDLINEVVEGGLCVYCGACAGGCPYLTAYKGRIVVMDNCDREDGQCYQFCPRTFTDMDFLSNKFFGEPFGANEIGFSRNLLLAKAADARIHEGGQDGGVVTALLTVAIEEGLIDAAIVAKMDEEKRPNGFVARTGEQLLECARNSYEPCPTLQELNGLPYDSTEKLGIVSLPCHSAALSKMKAYKTRNRVNIENVNLIIGLFCGWTLAEGFHGYLQDYFDLKNIVKFDIPHSPGHTYDAYYKDGTKKEVELEDIRKYINPACDYCWDMTAEFSDVSVGSGRSKYKGWNTLIPRTGTGEKLVELAMEKGVLETKPLPEENIMNLKKACLNKKKSAVRKLSEKYSGNLGYLGISHTLKEKLLSD